MCIGGRSLEGVVTWSFANTLNLGLLIRGKAPKRSAGKTILTVDNLTNKGD